VEKGLFHRPDVSEVSETIGKEVLSSVIAWQIEERPMLSRLAVHAILWLQPLIDVQ